jgi:hypothetical protein
MKTQIKITSIVAVSILILVLIFAEFYSFKVYDKVTTLDYSIHTAVHSAIIFSCIKIIGLMYLLVLLYLKGMKIYNDSKLEKGAEEVLNRVNSLIDKLQSKAENNTPTAKEINNTPIAKRERMFSLSNIPTSKYPQVTDYINKYGSPGNNAQAYDIFIKEVENLCETEPKAHLYRVILEEWVLLTKKEFEEGSAPYVDIMSKDMKKFETHAEGIFDKISKQYSMVIGLIDTIYSIGKGFVVLSAEVEK